MNTIQILILIFYLYGFYVIIRNIYYAVFPDKQEEKKFNEIVSSMDFTNVQSIQKSKTKLTKLNKENWSSKSRIISFIASSIWFFIGIFFTSQVMLFIILFLLEFVFIPLMVIIMGEKKYKNFRLVIMATSVAIISLIEYHHFIINK